MACLYIYNSGSGEKTYTKEDLIEQLKQNPIINKIILDPDFKNIDDLIENISRKIQVGTEEFKDIPEDVAEKLRTLKTNSKIIKLTPDGKNYINTLTGRLYQRVTSVFKDSPEESDLLTSASTIGTKIDNLVRDFFSNNLKSDMSGYGISSKKEYDSFIKQLESLKEKFKASVETVIADDILVYNDEVGVAGTVDLLTYDKDGTIRIYDMKTMRGNNFTKNNYGQSKYDSTAVFEKTGNLKPDGSPEYRVVSGKTQDSKREQHSKQLSLYRILLNNTNGLEASELFILPIAVDYNAKDTETKSAELLPTVQLEIQDSVKNINFKPEFKKEESTNKELSNRAKERLKIFITDQIEKLRKRIIEFESAKERKGFLPKKETLDNLNNLKEQLLNLENVDAFFEQVKFINNELKVTENFLDNKFDIQNNEHAQILFQILKQLNQYSEMAEILPSMLEYNSEIKKQGLEIDSMYHNVKARVNELLETHFKEFVKSNSSRKLTENELNNMIREMKDISWTEGKLGGLSNSMNPLLQLYHKHVEETREKVYDKTNAHMDQIVTAAKKLKDAGIQGFDWMFQKIDGTITGRILQKVSNKYYEAKRKLDDTLKNEFGDPKEYHQGPVSSLSKEQIAENIKLGNLKRARAEFMSAEISDEQGIRDGENHKFSDEFKRERNIYEMQVLDNNGKMKWVSRPFVQGSVDQSGVRLTPESYDRLYKAHRRKYYTETKEYPVLNKVKVGNEWVPDGSVVMQKMNFVKSEHIEIVTEVNGKPTKFADAEYYKLLGDNTRDGNLKREYFEFYKAKSAELLANVPQKHATKMKNNIFRIKSSLINDIQTLGIFETVKRGVRNFINPDIIVSQEMLDENGNPIEDIPVAFMGNLKSNKSIENLNKKLADLRAQLIKTPNDKSLTNKIMLAKSLLLQEEQKLTVNELELDMTKSLSQFAQMSENYALMKEAEGSLLMLRHVINNTKYFKLNSAQQKEFLDSKNTNTIKRLDTYMRMIFYSNSTANQTKSAKLIQNFNKMLAYKSLGLNPFSGINNAIMANINNRIEAFGKQFGFNNKDLFKAQGIVTGYITSTSPTKYFGKDRHLIKPTNKFEAMLKKFNWIDKNQIIDDSSTLSKIMFMGITGGEFLAQSSTAIAKLDSEMLTNSKTGEKLSVWEAHEFVNGELKLKDGFEYSDNSRVKATVNIKNMNKLIHGNYSESDKVAMQETALGQSAMQFKKWMYNFGKSRWGNTYYDETMQSNAEGRYRTVGNFIALLKAGQMYDWNSIKGALNSLDDYQKSNLKKFAAEGMYWMMTAALMLVLEGIAKGIDDDDEELKMIVNFLRKQSDRIGGELDGAINPKTIYANIKSPVAGMRMLNDFGQLLTEMLKLPTNYLFGDDKDLYIVKGPNKGSLKVSKEFRDIVPVANLKGQFDQLMTSGNYYIGK